MCTSKAATCARSTAISRSCAALLERLPPGCVVDGEIVIAGPNGVDFDALQLRLHPAASRVEQLARATPASFVAFDVLAGGGRSLVSAPQRERRARLERPLANVAPPLSFGTRSRQRSVLRRPECRPLSPCARSTRRES